MTQIYDEHGYLRTDYILHNDVVAYQTAVSAFNETTIDICKPFNVYVEPACVFERELLDANTNINRVYDYSAADVIIIPRTCITKNSKNIYTRCSLTQDKLKFISYDDNNVDESTKVGCFHTLTKTMSTYIYDKFSKLKPYNDKLLSEAFLHILLQTNASPEFNTIIMYLNSEDAATFKIGVSVLSTVPVNKYRYEICKLLDFDITDTARRNLSENLVFNRLILSQLLSTGYSQHAVFCKLNIDKFTDKQQLEWFNLVVFKFITDIIIKHPVYHVLTETNAVLKFDWGTEDVKKQQVTVKLSAFIKEARDNYTESYKKPLKFCTVSEWCARFYSQLKGDELREVQECLEECFTEKARIYPYFINPIKIELC